MRLMPRRASVESRISKGTADPTLSRSPPMNASTTYHILALGGVWLAVSGVLLHIAYEREGWQQ